MVAPFYKATTELSEEEEETEQGQDLRGRSRSRGREFYKSREAGEDRNKREHHTAYKCDKFNSWQWFLKVPRRTEHLQE